MTDHEQQDIGGLLQAWSDGDEEALKRVIPVVYPELRRIARHHLFRRPSHHTMESAALANEACLQLLRGRGIDCDNRVHFFALCAQIIRRILVDDSRHRGYAKRGGDAVRVPLDEVFLGTKARGIEVLALDQALTLLAKIDSRKAHVVELRYFGGLSRGENAGFLQVSPQTGQPEW